MQNVNPVQEDVREFFIKMDQSFNSSREVAEFQAAVITHLAKSMCLHVRDSAIDEAADMVVGHLRKCIQEERDDPIAKVLRNLARVARKF